MRVFWVLALAFSSSVSIGETAADIAGTLPEDYLPDLKRVLESALKRSPTVLLRETQLARSEALLYVANRQRWPNLGGDIRYNSNETGVSGSSNTAQRAAGLFYSLQADQAIFHWGDIKRSGQIARIELAVAEKDFAEAYRLLANQLRQIYLDLIAQNARLRHARFGIELKEAELAGAKERMKSGAASGVELAGRELELRELRLQADQFAASFDGDRRRLSRLAGIPLSAEEIPLEIPLPRYDAKMAAEHLAAVLRDSGRRTFAAQVAELRIRQAELNYQTARFRLLPKFNAGMSHSKESSTTATQTEISQTAITRNSIEVRGNWTIFDGFATRGWKMAARADKRNWEYVLRQETEAAMDEAQQLERAAGLSFRALELAEGRLSTATEAVRRTQQDLKAGNASPAFLNETLRNLRYAEFFAAQARARFLSDWSGFVSRIGEDPVLNHLPPRYVRPTR